MPRERFSITLYPHVFERLEQHRTTDRSSFINTALDRYLDILERARKHLAEILSDDEMAYILDVCNGTVFANGISIYMLPLEIEDSIPDGYPEKWKVDGSALAEKLRGLSFGESVALVDAIERWWDRTGEGEQLPFSEALKK